MLHSGKICVLIVALVLAQASGRWRPPLWNELVADTVWLNSLADSLPALQSELGVVDRRPLPPNILGIQQTKKYQIFPVDQYLALRAPVAAQLAQVMQHHDVTKEGILVIEYLQLWYDNHPAFASGYKLNGYSRLVDSIGNTLRDWQWELFQRPGKKQKAADCYNLLYNQWLGEQTIALKQPTFKNDAPSPYRYRRQLMTWLDWILFADGYALNAHLTLDYPSDQLSHFVRGSPGIYYRRSSRHESIAIGGKDQRWYWRLHSDWLVQVYCSYRLGFNNFNARYFSYVDIWNIMLINLSGGIGLEYRPMYHRGLFFGVGLHQAVNLLPTVIKRWDTGLALSLGVVLP